MTLRFALDAGRARLPGQPVYRCVEGVVYFGIDLSGNAHETALKA